MFRVRRNEDVSADVDSGARAFFERDDGKPIEEVIQHLLPLGGGLLGYTVADLRRRRKDTTVVPNLSKTTQASDRSGGAEGEQVAVIDFCRETSCTDLVEAEVLVEVEGEAVGAYCPVEGHEHLPLLGVPNALHTSNQSRALRHQELLMIVRVIIGRQHDEDRARKTSINMIRSEERRVGKECSS